ncbi:MMPL family transporter [Smaragdicoccus niigatensis]|uniref:MMPL family transporter n=1 Tax=Smaragdicoccus niigatensis TaxID=359359 RepID=UPI00037B4271|nr:MMPL family transporter [Smaragdicoccus niigatensis]
MATLLYRLGKGAYRRWPIAIAVWLIAIIGVGAVAGTMSNPMSNSFSIPGIESEKAANLQSELFGGGKSAMDQASVSLVVAAPEGHTLTEPKYADAVNGLLTDLADGSQMPKTPLVGPVEAAAGQKQMMVTAAEARGTPADVAEANAAAMSPLSPDERVGTINFAFDVPTITDVKPEAQKDVTAAMDAARKTGLTVEASGPGMQSQEQAGASSEMLGVAVALVVLALTFGSLVAAGLPLITALIGVGLGVSGITAMTAFTEVGASTPMLATMIGLGVGIDYALFILARYRSELEKTDDRAEAIGIAVGTAGSAVVFAGATVIIALAALSVTGIPFLAAMGWGAAATVTVAVFVALTLLPAVLGIFKSKAFAGRIRREKPKHASGETNGVRWARLVGRAPIAVAMIVFIGLGAIALPLKDLHLALPGDSTASEQTTQRKASDLISESFGPGRQAPMLVVVDGRALNAADRPGAYGQILNWIDLHDDVANAQIVASNADGSGAQIMITPKSGPESVATEMLLDSLREGQPSIESKTGTTIGVTGLTAIQTDVSKKLADALPVYLAVVIGLAFVLLMVVFRSLLVPLTATLGFLLSVLATLGATVLVFQEGAFGWFHGQPIISFMPIFLIGLVFGLAMDYQVFLVTRMREAHVHGMSAREAVIDGFRSSARVVTAAALIMISVFSGFMLMDEPIVQSMGFALAVAVFFDAFIVRMALIPALMFLMGEKAWYLPKWLDRILPKVDVEGESLQKAKVVDSAIDGDKDDEKELVLVRG